MAAKVRIAIPLIIVAISNCAPVQCSPTTELSAAGDRDTWILGVPTYAPSCEMQFPGRPDLLAELKQPSKNAHYLRGCDLEKKKLYAEAVKEITWAIEDEPKNAGLLYQRFHWEDQLHPANGTDHAMLLRQMADISLAIKLKPHPTYYLERSYMYAAAHNLKDEFVDLNAALKLYPQYPAAHRTLGIAMDNSGRFKDAVHEYDLAIKALPQWSEFWKLRAESLRGLGQIDESIKSNDKAFALSKSNPDFQIEIIERRADAYTLLGKLHTALIDVNNGLQLVAHAKPENRKQLRYLMLLERAHIYGLMGETAKALADINLCMAEGHTAEVYVYRGTILRDSGNLQEAAHDFEKAVALEPSSAQNRCLLASVYGRIGRKEEAITQARQALQYNPNYWNASHILAALESQNGEGEQAIVDAEMDRRMVDARKRNVLPISQSELKRLIQAYSKMIKLDSRSALCYDRAVLCIGAGEYDMALKDLATVRQNSIKGNTAVMSALLTWVIYVLKNDNQSAQKAANEACALSTKYGFVKNLALLAAGKTTTKELIATARDPMTTMQAHFFVGVYELSRGNKKAAIQEFIAVRAQGDSTTDEFFLAVQILNKINNS